MDTAIAGGEIFKAIPAIMGEINAVGKSKKNQQQGFMYRGVDDVMNAINPALVRHKVFIVPEVIEQKREDRQTARGASLIYSICKMRFLFCAEDGSRVEAVTVGEGMDSGDKATNKAMAIAFKYACFQVFCIPTEEMKDPDGESHDIGPGNSREKKSTGGYSQANGMQNHGASEEASDALIDHVKIDVVRKKIAQKGVSEAAVLKTYQLDAFEKMSMAQWMDAMKQLDKYKDKKEG
jgi:ERF superfamily.